MALCWSLLLVFLSSSNAVFLNKWAVRIDGDHAQADSLAAQHGFTNIGQIGSLEGHYLFEHHHVEKRSLNSSPHHHARLEEHPKVHWVEQQEAKTRVKRDDTYRYSEKAVSNLNDPLWSDMWYLHGGATGGFDLGVVGAWRKGYSGRGVVVTILDDGIEYTHDDLKQNYDPDASLDINGQDKDPMPRYEDTDENKHGTRCAGEVAASANNSHCVPGVAFNARIGGVRMLDGDVSDFVEAQALSLNPQHIDIYSASWGPDDNGKVVDGPAKLAREAFIQGVLNGRGGKGSIYVWASGNGGSLSDSCSCDGYTNSIFTLSVSSASEHNRKPWYLEECASTLATTYSSGENYHERKVMSTDLHNGCTDKHTGTSASAPLAAGMCALALEANPELTWRDMQYIVLMSSIYAPLGDGQWVTNGVGRYVSHKYGYGLMNAEAMVAYAERWTAVPEQHICLSDTKMVDTAVEGETMTLEMETDGCRKTVNSIKHLEHVQAKVTLTYSRRGDLQLRLISPNGTQSTLLPRRKNDYVHGEFKDWPFMSVFYWGENPSGTWKLIIENAGSMRNSGVFLKWQLIMYGTETPPVNLKEVGVNSGFDYIEYGAIVNKEDEFLWSDNEEEHKCNSLCDANSRCSGPTPGECEQCSYARLHVHGPCVDACPQGSFLDTNAGICEMCTEPCLKCKGPDTTTDCTSCIKGFLLIPQLGSCQRACPHEYYTAAFQKVCVPCVNHCDSCPDSPDRCLACADGYESLQDGSVCSAYCHRTEYRNSLLQCEQCDASCSGCFGPSSTDCLQCATDFVTQVNECRINCSDGFFLAPESSSCLNCHSTCKTCTGSAIDLCRECYSPFVLTVQGACEESCPHGSYEDATSACVHCNSACSTCRGPSATQCLSCPTSKVFHSGQCLDLCPNGYYAEGAICIPCYSTCATCQSSQACVTCHAGLFITHEGTCLSHCPQREYAHQHRCLDCHSSCASCHGPNATNCLGCLGNTYLHHARCLATCPDGFFTLGNRCQACELPCVNCVAFGAENCLSCVDGFSKHDGLCAPIKSTCKHNEFFREETQECEMCDSSCETCSGEGSHHCLTCPLTSLYHPSRHQCIQCCPVQHSSNLYLECCLCDELQKMAGTCMEIHLLPPSTTVTSDYATSGVTHGAANSRAASAWKGVVTIVVLLCLLSAIVFCAVFGILQAKAHDRLCWKHRYEPVPMHYHNGKGQSKVVSLAAYKDEEEDEDVFSTA